MFLNIINLTHSTLSASLEQKSYYQKALSKEILQQHFYVKLRTDRYRILRLKYTIDMKLSIYIEQN